ncbi:DUF1413 domain-containing protein [Janthinobacterium agaricidamnosum]|uniref:DUF1413 domain-containing protein n=1 Tax=Janthinobacterium agaricidamnosum TaxID=55508 RepID=UPI0009E9ECAC|nr:DUF1413 domain-containing protein [Janthinobacterium agaricidamnosum]
MKNVRVVMSDEAYERLKLKAKTSGCPGIGAYLLSKVGELTYDAEAHSIARLAERRARARPIDGEPFILKKLFSKDEWAGYSKPARIAAGKEFFASVECGLLEGVVEGGKTGSNHQTYQRV